LKGNLVQFPWRQRRIDHEESRYAAELALSMPVAERTGKARELSLDDPELLLSVCEILRSQLETSPVTVREDSEFFYRHIEKPIRRIGLHDEREYYLGEFALTAGTANRVAFRTSEAKIWLQRAEANFALVQNSNAHWARVAYQRLALAAEERQFDEVLSLADLWATTFLRLDMPEDAIKCRFLEGAVCWELGQGERAIAIHKQICMEAEAIGSLRLVAQAASNLTRYYGVRGETEEALSYARKALPMLQKLGSQVHLVKLRWSVGELLRKTGKRSAALDAYRQAQGDARELGMRGDLAALHLVVADFLLEAGQDAQAEWEIRAALPIIDEEKMVPEGIAALSLLRESVRRRQIDKQALRDLHGYFQEQ
jgi:tetratricopeptide (TPR) repeat protein